MTKEEIQLLYEFTSKHFVEHYDLQTELVDHLALGIEDLQKENPHMGFEVALQLVFKEFGVFGFSDVIKKRRTAMNRRYLGIIWNFFKSYFKPPKILIFVVSVFGYYTALHALPTQFQYYLLFGTLCSAFLFLTFKAFLFRNVQKKKTKKWLLEELIFNQIALLNLAMIPIQLLSFSGEYEVIYPATQILLSVLAVCYFIFIYIVTIVIPTNASNLLKKTYPEYEML